MGNTDDNKFDNFADIAGNYNILVPIIQRDYVQGSEVNKVNRDSFIRKILKSLETGKELDMQYIYGVLKGEDVFLPIDGQQRLTTSYLISWFCAVREERFEDFLKNTKSFSYQVRTSSTDFFDELRNPNNLDEFEEYVDGKKDNLKNSKWYKRKWRPDNTINNAISMLDAVRKICDEEIGDKYLFDTIFPDQEKKVQGKRCPLKFIMIIQNKQIVSDGEKSDLDDNMFETENRAAVTYINMNSRGKQLTEFESLKNKLHRLSEDGKKFAEAYDKDYIDVFRRLVQCNESKSRIEQLDGLVNEMDSYAEKLLRLLFFDLKSFQNERDIKEKDIDAFREILDKNDENELPKDYFEIIEYVMSRNVIDDGKNQEYLSDYIKGRVSDRTWNFFRYIWAGFKQIDTNEWNRFMEHSGMDQLGAYNKGSLVKNIYKIINVISGDYNGSTMSYIYKNDIDKLYKSFNGNCDRVVIKEEQILAYMYLNERAKYKEIENIEYRLRHLFYICGYWDDPSDKTGEKWEILKEYKEYEILHRNGDEESLYLWKKLYYLKSLNRNDGQYMLPEKETDTSWYANANLLEWKEPNFGKAKTVLERTKACYEELSGMMKEARSNSLKEQLNKYIDELVGTLRKDEWLYYVLTNNIDDLFENRVVQEKSVYRYVDAGSGIDANYFLYVLARKSGNKVCKNGRLSLDKKPEISDSIWGIEKPEGYGYTNNKNLSIYFCMDMPALSKTDNQTEVMWDGKNHVIRAEILNEDGQNGVKIRTVMDDSTYDNIKKDINIIYEELVKWLQQQKTVNLQLLQDLEFGRDDKYTAAAGEIEKKVNEIIAKSNLNYGYKVKENCVHKNYNDLHIEICLADQQGNEYSPFFASNNHIEQFYLHTK